VYKIFYLTGQLFIYFKFKHKNVPSGIAMECSRVLEKGQTTMNLDQGYSENNREERPVRGRCRKFRETEKWREKYLKRRNFVEEEN
jgi:hypothetical protein